MLALVIRNARLLLPGGITEAGLAIESGKIVKIAKSASLPKADSYVDARRNLVIPGIIDSHVHFREPGLSHKEDWTTGSRAAASGGVTTVIDMPNTRPPTTTVKLLEEKKKIAIKKSIVDFGFHFGSTTDNVEEIKKAKNVGSTKVFMEASTGDMLIRDDKSLKQIFDASKRISVHAEGENVGKAVELALKTETDVYLCHISKKEEIGFIRNNKTRKTAVEVTPHHLFLTRDDEKRLGAFGLMKPRLGDKIDKLELWSALAGGIVDTIGSDHAPHTIEEKESPNPPFGVPGVETTLPLMLDAVNRNLLTIQKLVNLTSKNPAGIFGVKNKGLIKEGYDADLVIVDMKKKKKIENDRLLTKCGWSPFNGKTLRGWPIKTFVRGNLIFEDENVIKNRVVEVMFDE